MALNPKATTTKENVHIEFMKGLKELWMLLDIENAI
jgi:hypothetical protein